VEPLATSTSDLTAVPPSSLPLIVVNPEERTQGEMTGEAPKEGPTQEVLAQETTAQESPREVPTQEMMTRESP
jgi:hypothetical protein